MPTTSDDVVRAEWSGFGVFLMLSHSVLDMGLGILLASAIALLTVPLTKGRTVQSKPNADGPLPPAKAERDAANAVDSMELAANEASPGKVPASNVLDQKNAVVGARKGRAKRIAPLSTTIQACREAGHPNAATRLPAATGFADLETQPDDEPDRCSSVVNAKLAAEEDSWRRGGSVNTSLATSDDATREDTWTREQSILDASLVPTIDEAPAQDSWTRVEAAGTSAAQRMTSNRFATALSQIEAPDSRTKL